MLGSLEILELIEENNMITNYINLHKQLQPNGFDLTLKYVFKLNTHGVLYKDNKYIPNKIQIFPKNTIYSLNKGCYLIMFNEEIKLPKDISAITIQRSSLMRMLCHTQVGSWDVGYHGRGLSMLVVNNPHGVVLEKDVKIVQMLFFKVGQILNEYSGHYQEEGLEKEN
jgi:dUTP pyrophosphatase